MKNKVEVLAEFLINVMNVTKENFEKDETNILIHNCVKEVCRKYDFVEKKTGRVLQDGITE